MSYTYTVDVGNGIKTVFPFSFAGQDEGYLSVSNIQVFVAGTSVPFTVYLNDPNKAYLNSAPPVGAEVLIRRIMPKNVPFTDFSRGNPFSQDALNDTNLQQLYVVQELLDGFLPPGFYFKQDVNMGGHKLVNLGEGTSPGDSIRYEQWEDHEQRLDALENDLTGVTSRTIPYYYIATGGETRWQVSGRTFDSAIMFINGVFQNQSLGAFSISGNGFNFAEPLQKGDEVYALIGSTPATGSMVNDQDVGVQQPYTGSVARSQHDKNLESLSAKDFISIDAAFAAAAGGVLTIPPGDYYLDSTVVAGYSNTTIIAYGARFFANFDGLMFDLNPDANPSSIEPTSKSYINWFGGTFQCTITNPVNSVAIRAYGIRQVKIADCIFGNSSRKALNSAIQIAGLGGHHIQENRFLLVDKCIDCPQWATSASDVSGPITTSSFIGNNFILSSGQKAFYVRGGWNRWIIQGGFVNGSGEAVFHFTNYADCKGLNIIGVGFEQAVAGGKFLYIQDTSGLSASSINISGASFNGDPAAGGHSAIRLERCINVSIGDGSRIEGSLARNNNAIWCDANCQDIVIDPSCRIPDAGTTLLMPRTFASVGKQVQRVFNLNLAGYNGDAKSSGTVTLDMKTLLGTSYPKQAAPLAYDILVQARDSGSAASSSALVEVMTSLTGVATSRAMVDLRGVVNDQRVAETIHVNADADGSISLQFYATGTGTMDVWIYVLTIYN